MTTSTKTFKTVSDIREAAPKRTVNGEEHGLIKVFPNSVPDTDLKRFKEKDREAMKAKKKHESEIIEAKYINTKNGMKRLPTCYGKWEGDPMLQYNFIHGEVYEIPRGLADEWNNKKLMKRSGLMDKNGQDILKEDQSYQSEHMFVAVGF